MGGPPTSEDTKVRARQVNPNPASSPVMAQVELTRHLKDIFPVLKEAPFTVEAATAADVVAELERIAPGVGFYLCDERGRLRQHVNIFIDEEMICDRGKLSDRLETNSRVFIAQALSGG